jgi:HAD superfamily phosphatase (TIGR01668 family)
VLSRYLIPDYILSDYRKITPEFLASLGVRGLLIDIDNTLAPYEQPTPDEHHRAWFEALDEQGIRSALISNNHRARVDAFNATLGREAYWHSGKPFGRTFKKVMRGWGLPREQVAVLGDQLLTDALGAKALGLRVIIVPPIRDKKTAFVRFKRWLERPYIKAYHKKHEKEDTNG